MADGKRASPKSQAVKLKPYTPVVPKIDFLMLSAGRIVKCVVMSAAAVGLVAVCSNLKASDAKCTAGG